MGSLSSKAWARSTVTAGSRVKIRVQDLAVGLGLKEILLPQVIQSDPSTPDIKINLENMNISRVVPTNGKAEYLFDLPDNEAEFDAICTLATVQLMVNMFRSCLQENGVAAGTVWSGGNKQIQCSPWSDIKNNARYMINSQGAFLQFGSSPDGRRFCRSFDVISHETGHALLDGMQPAMIWNRSMESTAVHEAFGDLTAVFGVLDQLDLCLMIVIRSGQNLHRRNFLSVIYEDLRENGMRDLNTDIKMSEVFQEAHAVSVVFTSAIYETIADVFDLRKEEMNTKSIYEMAKILHDFGHHLYGRVLMAFKSAPKKVTFSVIIDYILRKETDAKVRDIMKNNFEARELMQPSFLSLAKPLAEGESIVDNCCATLQHYYENNAEVAANNEEEKYENKNDKDYKENYENKDDKDYK